MRCEICGQGALQGVSVYAIDPPGVDGRRWRCVVHLPPKHEVDSDVRDIVELIENDEEEKS